MNNLKQYAGLLNEVAPEGEFLAYINNDEEKMLREAGGKGILTESGIKSYRGAGGYQGGGGSSSGGGSSGGGNSGGGNSGGGGFAAARQAMTSNAAYSAPSNTSASTNTGGGDNNYPDRIQRISSGVEPGYTSTSSQPFGVSPEQAYQEGKITVDEYRQAQQVQDNAALNDPNLIEKAFDLYKQYGIIPNALKLGGSLLDKIGGASKSLQDKAMTFSLNKRLSDIYEDNPDFEDYESVSEIPGEIGSKVQDLESDLQGIRDGTFTQTNFTEKYGSGDSANFLSERDAINTLTPYAPYAISGQTPQNSMVNDYFSNMGSNLGVSSAYMNTYNDAKNKISQS